MDEASHLDDDDDSIAGRWVVGNVDDSERALVRDLLVPLTIVSTESLPYAYLSIHKPYSILFWSIGELQLSSRARCFT